MKKLIQIIAIIILSVMLMSCSDTGIQIGDTNGGISVGEGVNPKDRTTYCFDSYKQLKHELQSSSAKEIKDYGDSGQYYGKACTVTLKKFRSGEIKLVVPCYDGKEMPLRFIEGVSPVFFSTFGNCYIPCIWYRCIIDEQPLSVQLSYMSIYDSEALKSAGSAAEAIEIVDPTLLPSSNPIIKEFYKDIYEKTVTLQDGTSEVVMFLESADSTRMYVRLYIGSIMIYMDAPNNIFTDDFWSHFGLKEA